MNGCPEFGFLFFSFFGFDTAYFMICCHVNQVWNMLRAKTEFKIIGPSIRCERLRFTESKQLIYWWCICRCAHVNLLFLLPPYYGVFLLPAASSLLPLLPDRRPATPGSHGSCSPRVCRARGHGRSRAYRAGPASPRLLAAQVCRLCRVPRHRSLTGRRWRQ